MIFYLLTDTNSYCQNLAKTKIEQQVIKGLDFILSHLKNPNRWPRTISTKSTDGKQITVYSKQEALSYYKDSNYLDCRISAYNAKTKEQTIDLLMIDLDLSNFKSNIIISRH